MPNALKNIRTLFYTQKALKPFLFAALVLSSTIANASPLQFQNARIPEAPPGAKVMAGYMTIVNDNKTVHSIIKITSPDFESVEMHRSILKDGVASMQAIKSLLVPAEGSVELAPGGNHLMLIKPKKQYYEGNLLLLKLLEKDGTEHTLAISVKKMQEKEMHQHHHHD